MGYYSVSAESVNKLDIFTVTNCLLNVLLMPLAIAGNLFVLVAVFKTPSLRSPSTIFLCSLAVSDLLVGLVVQPVYIAYTLDLGPVLRHTFNVLSSLGCGVSLCTTTAISVDRCLALHYHMRYLNLMSDKRAIYTSLSIWFLVIFQSCLRLWSVFYARLGLAAGIAICTLTSTVLYIRIYRIARRHQIQIHIQQQAVQTVSADHNMNMVRWKKSALNTFIYYISMILCYLPTFAAMLAMAINPSLLREEWDLTITVTFMNSSINPILYCWRLHELRTAGLKIIRELLRK